MTNALTSKVDLSTVLEQIVSGVSKALNVASFIVLLDRYDYRLRLETQCGLEKEPLEHVLQRDSGKSEKSIFWQTLKRRQPLCSQDIAADEHYPDSHNLSTELGLRSLYCYPLTTGTTAYGALVLCSTETGGFTPLKADILALFANQATVALHNDMLWTSVNQRRKFQESIERLDQTQQVITDHVTSEQEGMEFELFKQVREETQRTFGLSFGSLMNWVSEHLLTQSERDLQAIRNSIQNEQVLGLLRFPIEVEHLATSPLLLKDKLLGPNANVGTSFGETQDVLAQTAASALTTAAMLGELDRLITHLKLSTNWVKDAWFVMDLNGYCLYMNPAARQLCELSLEELSADYYHHMLASSLAQGQAVGPSIFEVFAKLIPRMRNADDVCRYLQDFTQDSMYRQEICCVLADEHVLIQRQHQQHAGMAGSTAHYDGTASDHHYQFTRYLLYTQAGQLEAIALQVQDVTEQVRDEKNRSALLSAFSHDLRTPLTTIKAAVTGLLEPEFHWSDDDRRDMLEDIDSEADHLNVLVNALIELSRIEMGAMEVKREWCDISEIFYGALPKLKRALAHRQLLTQIQSPLPLVYVDHARLAQVMFNLVENAARHSSDGTKIHLMIDIMPDGSEQLRVRIIDHGIRVLAHEFEHIFTPFQTGQSYGNGLALATCKGIIEAHQGHIWVELAEDAGSCFAFTLPIHPQSVVYREEKKLAELTGSDVAPVPPNND